MIGGNITAIGQFLLQPMTELFSGNSFRFHLWLLEIIFAQAKHKRCVYISAYIYKNIYTRTILHRFIRKFPFEVHVQNARTRMRLVHVDDQA